MVPAPPSRATAGKRGATSGRMPDAAAFATMAASPYSPSSTVPRIIRTMGMSAFMCITASTEIRKYGIDCRASCRYARPGVTNRREPTQRR